MGERLNSPRPKLCLESNVLTGQSFLSLYFSYFRAIETLYHCTVPVAIMTSRATNDPLVLGLYIMNRIKKELEENQYYGLNPNSGTLMPQIEVPSVIDSNGTLAIKEDGHLLLKPHGHGDIHTLLYQYGLPQQWKRINKRHIIFMQDTNILAMYGFACLLGLSVSNHLDFTSLGIVRKPGENVGSICRLQDSKGRRLTCNIEYCDFERLLMNLTGVGDEPNENGNSSYPGNINVLYANITTYLQTLDETHGTVPEFINPKYADDSHTYFKTPARLECMMQDLPRIMAQKSRVGYCSLPRWACFSAVKRNPESAIQEAKKTGFGESFYSMEEDFYKLFRRVLRMERIDVGSQEWDERITDPDGIPSLPILVLSPAASLTLSDMHSHFCGSLKMSDKSILLIDGTNIFLENVVLDGTLIIRACPGANVYIRDATIQNDGWIMKRKPEDPFRRYEIIIYDHLDMNWKREMQESSYLTSQERTISNLFFKINSRGYRFFVKNE